MASVVCVPRREPQPPSPPADDKDWTWVIDRPCPDCGYDASTVRRDDLPRRIVVEADAVRAALARPDATRRDRPDVWSVLEYGCHVRDACRVFGERLRLMLDEDDPLFPNWDQDETARTERYWTQSPAVVADELSVAAQQLAERFAAVSGGQWQRPGRRSNGSTFTVESLGRYLLHDLVHHVHDIRA